MSSRYKNGSCHHFADQPFYAIHLHKTAALVAELLPQNNRCRLLFSLFPMSETLLCKDLFYYLPSLNFLSKCINTTQDAIAFTQKIMAPLPAVIANDANDAEQCTLPYSIQQTLLY